MAFDLVKLLTDVFDPEAGEKVTVACDVPNAQPDDTPKWSDRRLMAAEWREAFVALGRARGFSVNPLLTYPATGTNNGDLPEHGTMDGRSVAIEEVLLDTTLACFLTQFSATAPLDRLTHRAIDFRAASMPGLERRMEHTALAADYREVARRCRILEALLRGAEELEVAFSTGHTCLFDLRYRNPETDDGSLPRHKEGDRVINLPSGETFIVPYEGERSGEPSRTVGVIPVQAGADLVLFHVEANRIARVEGRGAEAAGFSASFAADPARANVAEVAFGCNEWAEVTGNVLEDEKAGFHWAFGRSEHLGGTVGPESFVSRSTVVHQDIVYARGNPIQVARAVLRKDGAPRTVILDGAYVVF
ncbi:MAG: hypothetical protein ACOY3Y_12505 [Acidobacteriota bacterium]